MLMAFVCSLALVAAAAPPLEEDIDFQEGKRLIDELDYERAVFRFQKLTKSDRPAEQRAVVHAWLGATYANLGDEAEAIKAFVVAIKLDPLVALPPSSPKVAQIFDKARQKAREEVKRDTDGDGIADGEDACPTQAENMNGHKDDDGCPDVPPPPDSDGDGLTDDVDTCPAQPETKNGMHDDDGCPDELPPPAPKGPSGMLIGGAVLAGFGALGAGVGGVLGFIAQDTNSQAQTAAFQIERRDLAAQANNLALGANVAYIAGGSIAVLGAALAVTGLVGGDA